MLITAAGKVIGNVMLNIDREAIVPAVKYHHELIMLFDDDDEIKGDINVVAGGATTLVAKEQQLIRLTEFLGIINNDFDNQIIGIKGRAALLRMVMQQFPVNVDEIIPSDEEVQSIQKEAEARVAAEDAIAAGEVPANAGELNIDGSPAAGGDFGLFGQTKAPK